jgi:hypothetical protein
VPANTSLQLYFEGQGSTVGANQGHDFAANNGIYYNDTTLASDPDSSSTGAHSPDLRPSDTVAPFFPVEVRVSFVRPRAAAQLVVNVQTGNGTGGYHTFINYEPPPPATNGAQRPYNVSCTGTAIGGSETSQLWLLPPPADDLVNMTIYSDNIVIESYMQDGRVAYTQTGLDGRSPDGNGVRIDCHSADPAGCEIKSAEVWQLDSIWVSEEELLATPRQDKPRQRKSSQ